MSGTVRLEKGRALVVAAILALVVLAGCGAKVGTISGTVTDADTDLALSGVTVAATVEGDTYTTTTDANGAFTVAGVPEGTGTLRFTLADYAFDDVTVTVVAGATAQVAATGTQYVGTIAGTVVDAVTDAGLSGVTVTVTVGAEFVTTTSDDYGAFSLTDVPVGSRTLACTLDGYVFGDQTVIVAADATTTVTLVGTEILAAGEFRFVLTWGATPYDLDSHILLPDSEEVYFGNYASDDGYVALDNDDTSSYGPETITVYASATAGTYHYFVHNYSGSPDITTSGAQVSLYDSTGLVCTFDVPTTGTGYYWDVCTLDTSTGTYTLIDTVTSTYPTGSLARRPARK